MTHLLGWVHTARIQNAAYAVCLVIKNKGWYNFEFTFANLIHEKNEIRGYRDPIPSPDSVPCRWPENAGPDIG